MTADLFTRARLSGLVIVLAAFGLGVTLGHLMASRPPGGVVVTMTATDGIPTELLALGLSEPQQQQVRSILRAGRPRVMRVLEDMEPRMREALQLTEAEIEGVLQPDQRLRWKEFRRLNPPRTERRFIDR